MPAETVIQVRSDTASNWTSVNPTLASGELGFETDTGKFKIGNGSTVWNSLGYQNTSGPAGPTGPIGLTGPTGPTGDDGIVVSATAPSNTDIIWVDTTTEAGSVAMPSGGTTDQVLFKNSSTNYDVSWRDIPGVPVFIQTTQPTESTYLWIDTSDGDIQFLIEDGQ